MPKWKINRSADLLSVRWRWFEAHYLAGVVVVAMLAVAACVFAQWAFTGITAVVAYPLAVRLINATRIELDRDAVHVRYGPLPWFKSRDLAFRELCGVAVREGIGWELVALTHTGVAVTLIRELPAPSLAKWLRYELTHQAPSSAAQQAPKSAALQPPSGAAQLAPGGGALQTPSGAPPA